MHIRSLVLACCLAVFAQAAHANTYGVINTTLRPGDSGNGCASCHGASPSVVDVQVQGDSGVLPGASARYSVIIDNISNASARGGFTAAITWNPGDQPTFINVPGEPTATADSDTQIVQNNSELPLRFPIDGSVTYLINLSMPASATLGDEYTIYAVGDAGHRTTQVGWNFAPELTITAGPPVPGSLNADQANAGTTQIPLLWTGSDQGEHFRVLRKTGGEPDSATDAEAALVYEGADTDVVASGLTPGTRFYFAVYGKAPDEAFYSEDAARTIAASVPSDPDSLTLDPVTGSQVALSWSGASDEYRLLRKAGSDPAGPDDPEAVIVFEGSDTGTIDSGLDPDTEYFYRVWGKVTGMAVFSTGSVGTSWIERVFRDRFETE